ncbi:MAG: LysR family transcriptional regulator, partial [Selenomonadaceae bacterium]|nr:LysR family transcriptional regulator [Selenomonadaceae bacterium]
ERGKNRIRLNGTGQIAVEQAEKVLDATRQMMTAVREYDKSLRTIVVESCAPAPLWFAVPQLAKKYPAMTLSSSLAGNDEIMEHVREGSCHVGIVLTPPAEQGIHCRPYLRENLSICLPPNHPALQNAPASLDFRDINGFNCLLRSRLGFWDGLCRREMPASRFLVQEDDDEFQELMRNSTLPVFITNLAKYSEEDMNGRVSVPIIDASANVTYYLVSGNDAGILDAIVSDKNILAIVL